MDEKLHPDPKDYHEGKAATERFLQGVRKVDRKDLPQAKDIRGLFSKNKINTEELSEYLRN